MAAVRRMLEEGADIDQRDRGFAGPDGWFRRDPRNPDTFGETALGMAIKTKNMQMLRLLMDAGASTTTPDPARGGTDYAVLTAIHYGYTDGLRYLVDECSIPLQARDGRSDSWLLIGAIGSRGSVETLKYLIEEKGIDPAKPTENGLTAASSANEIGVPKEFLEYLYAKNAVPQGTQHIWATGKVEIAGSFRDDFQGVTGRHFSEFEKAMKMSERYTAHSTLLNAAVFSGDAEKVAVHLAHGARPMNADDKGVNAFDVLNRLEMGMSSIYRYRDVHAQVKQMLADAQKPAPTPPAPKP